MSASPTESSDNFTKIRDEIERQFTSNVMNVITKNTEKIPILKARGRFLMSYII